MTHHLPIHEPARPRRGRAAAMLVRGGPILILLLAAALCAAQTKDGSAPGGDDRSRVFAAPSDRVWSVTKSALLSLEWKVDKEDRAGGWMITKSRMVTGEEYGVYAKGTEHRLRVLVTPRDARTEVTVERRVWKEERILFVDKEEDIATTDRTEEKRVLDAIARTL